MEKVAAILSAILIVTSWVGADDVINHREIKVEEDTPLTLFCPGFSGPSLNDSVSSIKWFKDKVLVAIFQNTSGQPFIGFPKYNGRIYYEATNSSLRDGGLVINPAIQKHEGLYTCDVKTVSSMHSASLHLHVIVPDQGPMIAGLDTPIVAGKDTILACSMEVDSNTEVYVYWYFHDDNSTSGELIRKETRYGVDRVTSVILYSPADPNNVKDVTCTIVVNNVTFIATHEVNVIFGESGHMVQASAASLSWLFGVISLVMFLLFLFREWQWRKYVKKIQDRTVLTVDVPQGLNLKTVLFPGFQDGLKPFFQKTDSVNSKSSQKQLLSKPENNTNNVIKRQNSLLSDHTEVTIQSEPESDAKGDITDTPTIKNGTKDRLSLDKTDNINNRTSSSDC